MSEVYSECPNCGLDEFEGEDPLYNNGTGSAECLNCGWLETEDSEVEPTN